MSKYFGTFLDVTRDGRIFATALTSSNFALNASDNSPHHMASMFDGMSVATAENIIKHGVGRLGRPSRNQIWVPNDLIATPEEDQVRRESDPLYQDMKLVLEANK